MRRIIAFTTLATSTAALAADATLPNLAGRYYRQFPNGLVTGEKYTGENVVEIVPVAPDAAYVRIHLDYFNGHSCGISGIAQLKDETLVYQDPKGDYGNGLCVLKVRRSGKSLSIDDGEGSCRSFCGARGTLSEVTLPYASKRRIRYMARLRASYEYRAALIEWRTGKPYEPWKQSEPAPSQPVAPAEM